ncbi:unnamed protein product [Meloidogyne enterolobii]|uniref:Uncharacterized protein n=1 Tax=Meloidogyne enterolobii TaxID=390850 RepID=A0ACB0Y6U8_MELEN
MTSVPNFLSSELYQSCIDDKSWSVQELLGKNPNCSSAIILCLLRCSSVLFAIRRSKILQIGDVNAIGL